MLTTTTTTCNYGSVHWWPRHSSSCIGYRSINESRTNYVFSCTTSTPARLRNIWVTVSPRSSDTADYVLPRTRTRFGERGFQYSGLAAWNSLPADLHDITDTNTFKKRLKTVLFDRSYWLDLLLFTGRFVERCPRPTNRVLHCTIVL